MKTSELIGPALDWAVAKCEWVPWTFDCSAPDEIAHLCHYSTDWAQGGPIIEREQYNLNYDVLQSPNVYQADDGLDNVGNGPTPLVAAMRCLVASKLGDEVDVPEGLA